ncbi:MAG TPA: LPS-assembly protein LptD [Burkholderiaceae bacterium]|nr:LPS-assembly protein LptD [Burkholderiaceae bacterium]
MSLLAMAAHAQTETQPSAPTPPADRAWQGLQTSPALRTRQQVDDHDMGTFLVADRIETEPDGKLVLTGSAEVRRLDAVTKGDRIDYQSDDGHVTVTGNGMLMREGNIVKGPWLEYYLDAETGTITEPEFSLGDTGASGKADEAHILSRQHMKLSQVDYAGCPCPDPAWRIRSPDVDLRFDKNEGVARHGVLYFKKAPILYSPWLSFPLRKERKSGFLMPTYGMSSKSGVEFSAPYYFNLAPNYDATLTPRIISKRGVQLGGEFRYLGKRYEGLVEGTYLPSDRQRRMKRWWLHAEHQHVLGKGLTASFDLNRVSDDDYFRDLSNIGLSESTTDQLTSRARLNWRQSRYVNVRLSATKYQTLQDRTSRLYRRPQFDRLPELEVTAKRYNWGGFDVVSENTVTRFRMPHFIYGTHSYTGRYRYPELAPHQSHDGTRYQSYTSVAYPIVRPGWYITPKVGWHYTHYSTEWRGFGPPGAKWDKINKRYEPGPGSQTRSLPIVSLDAGMTFERDTSLFGHPTLQTLEPRAYYLRVPHRDQSTLPVYDTSLATFNITQAFDENIFNGGWDRIANANQLTLGLTSRWFNAASGAERLAITAAQRVYFQDQEVVLSPSHNPRTHRKSDYLLGINAALTDTLNVRFDGLFSAETRHRNRMSAGFRWRPKRLATVSASYRYERDRRALMYHRDPDPENRSERISVSAQWPLTSRWYAMGRFDYSIDEKRSTQSIMGLEYKGDCCWAARAVLQRYAVSRKDVNTAVFFQLELTGLGSLGTDAMGLLRDRVVGYEPVTPPESPLTTFERYE